MIRDREMSEHLWILAPPLNRCLKATPGQKIATGIVIVLAGGMIFALAVHVLFPSLFGP